MMIVRIYACVLFVVMVANTAHARPPVSQQIARYEVYAGGVNVLQATVIFDIQKNNLYAVDMTASLKGFLARLVPWKGSFDSNGWIVTQKNETEFVPRLHRSLATWRGDKEQKEYKYTKEGGFVELVVTENGKTEKEKSDAALTKNTTDALSAALAVFQKVAEGGECSGSADIYDGKRRFQQVFRDDGTEQLVNSKYNRFKGEASRCVVEVIPAGGEWHKKPRGWMSIQEQGRAAGALPTVWVGKMNNGGPAIPVKIRLKTSYGTLFLHLAEYTDSARINPKTTAEKKPDEKTKKP